MDISPSYTSQEHAKFLRKISTPNSRGQSSAQCKLARKALKMARKYLDCRDDFKAIIHSYKFTKEISGAVRHPGTCAHWLKTGLFITDRSYVPNKISMQYVINKEFYEELINATNQQGDPPMTKRLTIVDDLRNSYHSELNCDAPFKYEIKPCGRYYHPVIGVERPIKEELFAYWDDYDVSACAPNLLHQLYVNEGNDPLPHISFYLTHKAEFRSTIAARYGVNKEVAKPWITGLFNGARLNNWRTPKNQTEKQKVAHNIQKLILDQVRHDQQIINLKSDIKEMWKVLLPLVPEDKANWNLYLKEEARITEVFITYLSAITGQTNVGFFCEYDGFRLHKKYSHKFNRLALQEEIFLKTGYDVELKTSK
jgi:hypothetical protein